MARPPKCSPEFRESAIRMVAENGPDPTDASLASSASATEPSCKWVRRLKSTAVFDLGRPHSSSKCSDVTDGLSRQEAGSASI